MTEYEHVGSEGAKHDRANAASILVWTLLSPRMSDTKCPNICKLRKHKIISIFPNMKKLILFLSLAFFSFASANCLEYMMKFQVATIAMYDKDFDGLLLDSIYVDKGTANNRGERIYTWKGYYKDGTLDSIYEGDYRNGEWQYLGTKNTSSVTVTHEGNNWTLVGETINGDPQTKYYFDGDSLAIVTSDEGDEYTDIYVLRNDTLFRPSEDEITVMDEKDNNTCYVKNKYDNYAIIWYRYEVSFQDDKVILSKTYIEEELDNKVMTYFFIPRNTSITSILRKNRPAFIPEKAKHFDLLGRPAKGKHIIKVNR